MYDVNDHILKTTRAVGKKPKYLIVSKKNLADYPKNLRIESLLDCDWQVKLLLD